MPRINPAAALLLAAAALASATAFAVVSIPQKKTSFDTAISSGGRLQSVWVASAPGQIEPKGGYVRVPAAATGRVTQALVRLKDRVRAGDVMIVLDEEDLPARLKAAISALEARKRDRDAEKATGMALDRRTAEDNLYSAERALVQARMNLDEVTTRVMGGDAVNDVEQARFRLASVKDEAERLRSETNRVYSKAHNTPYTRLEASVIAARAEIATLDAAMSRTRIRAPVDATVLHVGIKAGELAAPTPDTPLVILGDTTGLQVRAELDERGAGKIQVGHTASISSDAFPGQRFGARVATIFPSLSTPRLIASGQRGRFDVDVLQVVLYVDGDAPLLPGARVDVYFEPDTKGLSSASAL